MYFYRERWNWFVSDRWHVLRCFYTQTTVLLTLCLSAVFEGYWHRQLGVTHAFSCHCIWEIGMCTYKRICLWCSHAAAAAAKSLQSCPTLWDPIDGSPPGSPVPGILQARTLERDHTDHLITDSLRWWKSFWSPFEWPERFRLVCF